MQTFEAVLFVVLAICGTLAAAGFLLCIAAAFGSIATGLWRNR